MDNIKILFWPYKSKPNKDGKVPIVLRITINGKKIQKRPGFFIKPSEWDGQKQIVKGSSETARSINSYIAATRTKALQLQSNFNLSNDSVISTELVLQKLLGIEPEKKTLLQLFDYHNNQIKQQIGKDFSEGTYKQYLVTRKKIQKFLKCTYKLNDFALESLTHKFVTDFDYYLKTVEGLGNNTAMKKIKQLKKLISIALANEWLIRNPFASFKCRYKEPEREVLTFDEISLLASKEFLTDRLNSVRDIFLFCCYTGLRFSDIQKLTPADIVKGIDGEQWLSLLMTKTGERCNVPLLPKALELIAKYKQNRECLRKRLLFPVRSNQKVNEYLKEIADLTGLKKKLHFHLSRHTFATTITLNEGVSLETVGKMLGHKSIKTTQIYAKLNDSRISNEMKALKSKLEVFAS